MKNGEYLKIFKHIFQTYIFEEIENKEIQIYLLNNKYLIPILNNFINYNSIFRNL